MWKGQSVQGSYTTSNPTAKDYKEYKSQFFMDNSGDGIFNTTGYGLLISPSLHQGNDRFIISVPLILNSDNKLIYSNLGNVDYRWVENLKYDLSTFHPQFSFPESNYTDIVLGDNSPINSCGIKNYFNIYSELKVADIRPSYIGRYGEEIRNYNYTYDSTYIVLKYNGEEKFNGEYYDYGNFGWFSEQHDDGIYEMTFTKLNVEVDGLAGKNVTKLIFDQTKEDWTPPSIQMLQFRNNEDKITDRFIHGVDGFVRIAAGDFQFDGIKHIFNYTNGNSVQLYYSPYSREEWSELPLTKKPEYFMLPAFGDYYEASLAPVVPSGATKWYDVRIVCTDAAGNSQEQIVSPAFKIDAGTQIPTAKATQRKSYMDENSLYIVSPVAETITVVSLVGTTVVSTEKTSGSAKINVSDLSKGVYIVKGGSGWCDKVLKK
jgi:hypothetical protein